MAFFRQPQTKAPIQAGNYHEALQRYEGQHTNHQKSRCAPPQ